MRVCVEGKKVTEDILNLLKKYDIEISNDPDVVITLGGDGSAIYGFRKYRKPILPVRFSDISKSLGFIAHTTSDDLDYVCRKLRDGKYEVEKFLLLDLYLNDEKICSSVNEIVLHQKNPLKAMRFDVYCDEKKLFEITRLVGDGVIIATPMGSTAYNASAGGYLLNYKNSEMVVTLNNVSGLTIKKEKSKRIDDDSAIRLELHRPDEAWLGIDGYEKYTMKSSDKAEVRKSEGNHFEIVSIEGMKETWHQKIRRRKKWLRSKV